MLTMQSAATVSENLPTCRPLSVLLVEDSEVTLDLLKMFLTNRGHTVHAVADGESALQRLLDRPFDFALMDYHLPKKDGLQVVVEYKSRRPKAQAPKFIGITADIEGLLSNPLNCENFDKVFRKPFNPMQICDELEGFSALDSPSGRLPSSDSVFARSDLSNGTSHLPIRGNVYQFPQSHGVDVAQDGEPEQEPAPAPVDAQIAEKRRTKRIEGDLGGTTITLADGSSLPCQISSISCGGAAMSVDTQPKIGAKVMVGKTPAWVVRHIEDGIAVEFTNELLRHAEIFSNTDSEEDSKSSADC